MHKEAWAGNGSDSSLILVGKRRLKILIQKNNDDADEPSVEEEFIILLSKCLSC